MDLVRKLEGVVTFAVVQIVWFSSVLGAARGIYWLGPVVALALAAAHLGYTRTWRRDLATMLGLAATGLVLDSLLTALGLLHFRGSPTSWLVPLWAVGLWLHFGVLRHSLLRMLYGRPLVAAVLGAIGGPFAYLAGVELGAATFHPNTAWSLLGVGVVWALALPWASHLAWRGVTRSEDVQTPAPTPRLLPVDGPEAVR
ncbi:MAG: DUF2878 domain-containing protein [Acidobacteriota bacterium]